MGRVQAEGVRRGQVTRRSLTSGNTAPPDESQEDRRRRLTWAELLQRVFQIDALECPYCGAKRKLIALITCLSAVASAKADPPTRALTRNQETQLGPFLDMPA